MKLSIIEYIFKGNKRFNCGGCGYPGCSGFANALVEGEATKVSACVVSNQETREKVATYLNETPGPDGKAVSVTI